MLDSLVGTGLSAVPSFEWAQVQLESLNCFLRKCWFRYWGISICNKLQRYHSNSNVKMPSEHPPHVVYRESIIPTYTSAGTIEDRVKTLASERGVDLVGTALIGFTPDEH